MANTIRPNLPLRLSWRITHTKKAISGNTKIAQKISDAAVMLAPYPPEGE